MPFTFADGSDYDRIDTDDTLALEGIREKIADGKPVTIKNLTKGEEYALNYDYSDRQTAMILAGGLLNYTKNLSKQEK